MVVNIAKDLVSRRSGAIVVSSRVDSVSWSDLPSVGDDWLGVVKMKRLYYKKDKVNIRNVMTLYRR